MLKVVIKYPGDTRNISSSVYQSIMSHSPSSVHDNVMGMGTAIRCVPGDNQRLMMSVVVLVLMVINLSFTLTSLTPPQHSTNDVSVWV